MLERVKPQLREGCSPVIAEYSKYTAHLGSYSFALFDCDKLDGRVHDVWDSIVIRFCEHFGSNSEASRTHSNGQSTFPWHNRSNCARWNAVCRGDFQHPRRVARRHDDAALAFAEKQCTDRHSVPRGEIHIGAEHFVAVAHNAFGECDSDAAVTAVMR